MFRSFVLQSHFVNLSLHLPVRVAVCVVLVFSVRISVFKLMGQISLFTQNLCEIMYDTDFRKLNCKGKLMLEFKEYIDIWGNRVICFLVKTSIERLIPVSCLYIKYKVRASSKLAQLNMEARKRVKASPALPKGKGIGLPAWYLVYSSIKLTSCGLKRGHFFKCFQSSFLTLSKKANKHISPSKVL